jgi:hypothetical protein
VSFSDIILRRIAIHPTACGSARADHHVVGRDTDPTVQGMHLPEQIEGLRAADLLHGKALLHDPARVETEDTSTQREVQRGLVVGDEGR